MGSKDWNAVDLVPVLKPNSLVAWDRVITDVGLEYPYLLVLWNTVHAKAPGVGEAQDFKAVMTTIGLSQATSDFCGKTYDGPYV